MLGVTLFGIFLTPVFYYVIQWLGDRKADSPGPGGPHQPDGKAEPGGIGDGRPRGPTNWSVGAIQSPSTSVPPGAHDDLPTRRSLPSPPGRRCPEGAG